MTRWHRTSRTADAGEAPLPVLAVLATVAPALSGHPLAWLVLAVILAIPVLTTLLASLA